VRDRQERGQLVIVAIFSRQSFIHFLFLQSLPNPWSSDMSPTAWTNELIRRVTGAGMDTVVSRASRVLLPQLILPHGRQQSDAYRNINDCPLQFATRGVS